MGSRWLDPSEVAKGPEMVACFWGRAMGAPERCPYPLFDGEHHLCRAHHDQDLRQMDKRDLPTLPPSPLVAAPRWSGKPPRIDGARLGHWLIRNAVEYKVNARKRRVRKVRDWHEPVAGCFACDGYAKWVLA